MAVDPRKRQKKLERRKAKQKAERRQLARTESRGMTARMEEASAALEALARREVVGKIVLVTEAGRRDPGAAPGGAPGRA